MKIFNSKNKEEVNNQNQIILEEIKSVKEIISNECKKRINYDLLEEKSELEKKLSKEQTSKEIAIRKYEELEKKTIEIVKNYGDEISSLQEKLTVEKTKVKISSNSVGGLRRQNNSLLKRLEQQTIYIKLLNKELKKYTRKVPNLKQLLDYEHTRKSPFLREKEKVNENKL